MLGHVPGSKAVEGSDLLGARQVRQHGGRGMRHEGKAGAMLGAVTAIVVVAVALLGAMTVIRMRLHSRAVIPGRANAAGHCRDAAQRNEREHRADEQ